MRSSNLLYYLLFVVCFGSLGLSAQAGEVTTEYMAIYCGWAKVGYTKITRTVQGEMICTETIVEMVTSDGREAWKYEWTETSGGKPLSFAKQKRDGSGRIAVIFQKGQMEVRHGRDGTYTQTKQFPEGLLLSEGENLLMKSKGLKEGVRYSYDSIDESTGELETVSIDVGPVKDVSILGKAERLHEVICRRGRFRSVNYLDDDCNYRKTLCSWGGSLDLEYVACDAALALSPNATLDTRGASILALPADISAYQDATAMEIVLVPDGRACIDIPSTDAQSVTRRPDGSFVVTIRKVKGPRGGGFPYQGKDAQLLEALRPTYAYECDNPQIVAMARGQVGSRTDAEQACLKLQSFVRTFIVNKDRSSDETALAIVQHRTGTCSQHAILMVALCRAVGIPAKLVAGLVAHSKNELSGHDWVQCYINGRWVDYDPTWGGFDVSHVALWTGAQEVDQGDLADKFGHLKAVQVHLEMPWYRSAGWWALVAVVPLAWFLYRRHKRRSPSPTPFTNPGLGVR